MSAIAIKYSDEEATRRMNEALRRALTSPPKPHSEMKLGKRKAKASQKASQTEASDGVMIVYDVQTLPKWRGNDWEALQAVSGWQSCLPDSFLKVPTVEVEAWLRRKLAARSHFVLRERY